MRQRFGWAICWIGFVLMLPGIVISAPGFFLFWLGDRLTIWDLKS